MEKLDLLYFENSVRNCFDKVKEQLDLGIDSNFDEFHQSYLKLYPTSTEPLEEIRREFYEMAFCIEVRKLYKKMDLEREFLNYYFNKFWNEN
jgi:hypothetical protein